MSEKFFTIEEADQLRVQISSKVEDIIDINRKINYTSKDIQDLFDIWGEAVKDNSNPDHELYLKIIEKSDLLAGELNERVSEVENTGCYVRDVEHGLIEFPFITNDRIVFLSWKIGEDKINYWNEENDVSRRRPIEDLMSKSVSGS